MTQQEAEQFLFAEVGLLDKRDYKGWRDLFAAEGVYWVPVNDTESDPQLNCSVIYAGAAQLDDRLERATSSYFWADQPAIKSVHTVSNVSVVAGKNTDEITLLANQVVYLFRDNDQRRDQGLEILPASSEYRLNRVDQCWRIGLKKLNFLQADGYLPLLPAFV